MFSVCLRFVYLPGGHVGLMHFSNSSLFPTQSFSSDVLRGISDMVHTRFLYPAPQVTLHSDQDPHCVKGLLTNRSKERNEKKI